MNAPRWPNGPEMCESANLPAFESKPAADAWIEQNCPGVSVLAMWQCRECAQWHFWASAHSDSYGGTLSGSHVIPMRIQKLIPLKIA